MNIYNLFFLFAASPDAARAAARDEPQLGRGRGLRRMKVHASLPALTSGCRCRPERDRGVELTRMEGPSFGAFLIAGKAPEPPGAIGEARGRGRGPAPGLFDCARRPGRLPAGEERRQAWGLPG